MREVIAVKDRMAVFVNLLFSIGFGLLFLYFINRNGSLYVSYRLVGFFGSSFIAAFCNFVCGVTLPYVLIEHDAEGIYIHRRLGKEEYIPFDDISSIHTFAEDKGVQSGEMPRMLDKIGEADYCGKLRILLRKGMTSVRFVKNVKSTKAHLRMLLSAYYKAKYDEDI